MRAMKEYQSLFPTCSTNQPIRLEASPRYLKQSAFVAKRISNILPDVKLIFILRNPVNVLLSYIAFVAVESGKSK